ncbi:bacillithiol biosynthesis deacetylase BshB2 [Gracilibacillus caseinilyticus]|uniref:Bacillithiol biosynthesis deacetylase BshB2 n=1 Tax=Gracilibacillus caseinilyticus TaxID=2932256 RepID=A0ABY4EWP1_9BACI|nr:bacillithiol biosynthesis deacetylase BshB2 [Gracilibacillus caseinilyticus]UOQ48267.1 bacillithiol biosynthesis deacetylase BshB2 [Gracilibacillus caseinilyticus]
MSEHVVVIYPHPDDEAFGASGTITTFRQKGIPVTYFCGTLGEMGRNMGNPTFANRETLPEIRKEELIKACKVLDINLEMLGYRDKTLEFESTEEVAQHLYTYLEEIKPSLVITHYPGHAVHPDHDAFGAAAIRAVEMIPAQERPVVWAQAISRTHTIELGEPDVVNDVSDVFEKKFDTIQAHKSQADGMLATVKNQEEDIMAAAKQWLGMESFYTWKY